MGYCGIDVWQSTLSISYKRQKQSLSYRALLWFIGIPYKITLEMIRFVMKVCHNASRTLVLVKSLKILFLGSLRSIRAN